MTFIPGQDSLVIGGRTFYNLTSMIILYGRVSTAARFTTMRKANGTAGYQVTAGKTYTVYAVQNHAGTASSGHVTMLYGDTDVGINSASAPTTPIYLAGDSTGTSIAEAANAASGAYIATIPGNMDFAVPAAKYAAMGSDIAGHYAQYYGFET